jgi:hypothetical protein
MPEKAIERIGIGAAGGGERADRARSGGNVVRHPESGGYVQGPGGREVGEGPEIHRDIMTRSSA